MVQTEGLAGGYKSVSLYQRSVVSDASYSEKSVYGRRIHKFLRSKNFQVFEVVNVWTDDSDSQHEGIKMTMILKTVNRPINCHNALNSSRHIA